jgi:hypothetical protein
VRRVVTALAMLGLLAALAAPAEGGKRHKSKAPSGIKGVVLNSTCCGACAYPPPPEPAYTGSDLTVSVTRVADGVVVASSQPSGGHFRFRLKRGLYRVTAAIGGPTPVAQASVMPPNCWQGESQEAQVRRHHFTRLELHVGNVCIV